MPALVTLAMAHLAAGRDDEAAEVLEPMLRRRPARSPVPVALLALSYLLRGEAVEVIGEGVSCVAASAEGLGEAEARGRRG